METHTWPWRENNRVIFLRKPNKKTYTNPSSYRPITISSYVGKLMERIIENRLRDFIESRNILPNSQHSFRKRNSTMSYLAKLITTVQHYKACKCKIAGIFLDLQKAFDSIWHDGMVYRLMELGISGRLLYVLNSFLKTRQVKLTVNEHTSPPKHCCVGLPQGSVLSPVLFIIYIRDMLSNSDGLQLQFADDCTLLTWAENDTQLQQLIQRNCDQISNWMNRWRIKANCTKTDIINFNSNIDAPKINGENINKSTESKVLGVTIDSELKFQSQLEISRNSLQRKWNMLTPLIRAGLNVSTTRKLLNTVILPKALYGAHLWDTDCKISIYYYLKEMMHIPYNPPEITLTTLAQMVPSDIGYCEKRLVIVKQLIASNDSEIFTNMKRSKLQKLFLADITRLMGRGFSIPNLQASDFKHSATHKLRKKEIARRWNKYLTTSQGLDGLLYMLPPDLLLSEKLSLHLNPKLFGKLASLLTGHCNLQLHKYKLGLTYTPTCVCRAADESVHHHIFQCKIYDNLRCQLDITNGACSLDSLVIFCNEAQRL